MYFSPSPKLVGGRVSVTLTLFILLGNLALFGERVEAIKCYMCTCYNDCILNKNLFRKEECASQYNACLTSIMPNHPKFIQKFCWIAPKSMTEDTSNPSITYKYCHSDYCNDMEYEGISNPNGSDSTSKITAWCIPLALALTLSKTFPSQAAIFER